MSLFVKVDGAQTTVMRCSRSPGPEWTMATQDIPAGARAIVVDGAVVVTQRQRTKKAKEVLMDALADILIAVGEGADLRDEINKALGAAITAALPDQ